MWIWLDNKCYKFIIVTETHRSTFTYRLIASLLHRYYDAFYNFDVNIAIKKICQVINGRRLVKSIYIPIRAAEILYQLNMHNKKLCKSNYCRNKKGLPFPIPRSLDSLCWKREMKKLSSMFVKQYKAPVKYIGMNDMLKKNCSFN